MSLHLTLASPFQIDPISVICGAMIETLRLQLIPCELAHFEALINDESRLAALLESGVPGGAAPQACHIDIDPEWLGFDAAREAMPHAYDFLKAHPSALGWWTYLFVHKPDRTLIGLGGFKGEVTDDGTVEIGYEIAPSYRRRGLAREAALGMIEYAFAHPEVKRVDAHTLPERNASTGVLEKVGMKHVGAVIDPDDGEVWHWSLSREEYEQG